LPSSCKKTLQRSRHQHPVSLKDDAFVCVIMLSVQILQTTTPEQCLQQLADLPRTGAALWSLTSHLATHHRQRPQAMQSRALRSITVCFRYRLLQQRTPTCEPLQNILNAVILRKLKFDRTSLPVTFGINSIDCL